ncbi:DUF2628 domain-containing protein [Bacillus sp. EAC]|uniref:DUF2628 domain-containing protein n=1 Tax=Bacillus sp. EAC TaxID=1978338 RepID=UPI000B440906|nr:DUF2628 domain-containing protein [Bacillus sp. EAC]
MSDVSKNEERLIEVTEESDELTDIERFKIFTRKNTKKYIERLNLTSQSDYDYLKKGKIISWNWASFFLGIYWMAYRKMWKFVAIYLVYFVVVDTLLRDQKGLSSSINFVVNLLLGMYGNSHYFSYSSKKIDGIKAKGLAKDDELSSLQKAGGPSIVSFLISIFIVLAFAFIMVLLEEHWSYQHN